MIRTVLLLLISIFLITLARYVIGTIARGFSGLSQPKGAARRMEPAGELKRDPVCGTFVAAATSLKKTVRGEVFHFCSAACRDKYGEN
jgi:YHS domain-containing protein